MQKFKLKRKAEDRSSGEDEKQTPFGTIKDPRKRIQLALDELFQISTKAQIEEASARGVKFSHEGFTKRIHVGTDTLRKSNSDLFAKLEERLLVLERIAGKPLRGQAAKREQRDQKLRRKIKQKENAATDDAHLQKLLDENGLLKQLLANAQEEILDLTHRLSMALHLPAE